MPVHKNELDAALVAAYTLGNKASTTTGLTWGYYGGVVQLSTGASLTVTDTTATLVNAAVNYIQMDLSSGSVSVNQTSFTASGFRWMAKVTTAGSAITASEDSRDISGILNEVTTALTAATTSTNAVVYAFLGY